MCLWIITCVCGIGVISAVSKKMGAPKIWQIVLLSINIPSIAIALDVAVPLFFIAFSITIAFLSENEDICIAIISVVKEFLLWQICPPDLVATVDIALNQYLVFWYLLLNLDCLIYWGLTVMFTKLLEILYIGIYLSFFQTYCFFFYSVKHLNVASEFKIKWNMKILNNKVKFWGNILFLKILFLQFLKFYRLDINLKEILLTF